MATRERRAEYSTSSSSNVVRVLSPSRPLSPNPPPNKYDEKLEYLLDDLQTSISRPGSSLGHNQPNSSATSYSTSSRDVQYLSPSNTTTIIRERSRSPTSDTQRVYKTAHYEYNSSANQPTEMQQNINQLDTLLSDLNSERERESSLDRKHLNRSKVSDIGIDSALLDNITPGTGGTTKIIKETTYTNYSGGKPQVQRELIFESPNDVINTITRESRPRQKSPEQKYYKTVEKTVTTKRDGYPPAVEDTGIYGGINRTVTTRTDRTLSPPKPEKFVASNTSKTYNYSSSSTKEDRIVPPNVPYNEVVHVETGSGVPLPSDIQLSDDILPKPSTKVTTTVRTYTYEIPAEPAVPPTTNKTIVYKNESYDTTNNVYPAQPPTIHTHPNSPTNQTIIYKNESHTTNNVDYPGTNPIIAYPQSQPPPGPNKTIIYKKDTRETTTNVYPKNQYPTPTNTNQYPIVEFPPEPSTRQTSPPPPGNTTVIYNEKITDTRNHHHHPPAGGVPVYPPTGGNTPPQPGPKTTYYYKHESSNTTNTHYGPPGGTGSPYPNDKHPRPTAVYPSNGYPPNDNHFAPPPNDTSVTYKHTTHTTNTINNKNSPGFPYEKEPLLKPTPFPTDGMGPDYNDGGNPPKRLDDLMATFGDTNRNNHYNHGPYVAEKPLTPTDNHNTLALQRSPDIVEQKTLSKNLTGPPVYYPPGHELFAKKEQSAAAWQAQGGYAKASGKYEYEAASKSKSKSSSGAAVVPVCLPLCCAMPCTIM